MRVRLPCDRKSERWRKIRKFEKKSKLAHRSRAIEEREDLLVCDEKPRGWPPESPFCRECMCINTESSGNRTTGSGDTQRLFVDWRVCSDFNVQSSNSLAEFTIIYHSFFLFFLVFLLLSTLVHCSSSIFIEQWISPSSGKKLDHQPTLRPREKRR